jgi:hypothetical protein
MIKRVWGRITARLALLSVLDRRSLAAFRIALGLLVILDVVLRSFDLRAFYTDGGVLPRADLIARFREEAHFSLLLSSGAPWFQVVIFVATLITAGALALGYRTRTAALATWILLVSIQRRNPLILQGGDVLFRIILFFAILLPLSRCWSIDAARRKRGEDSSSMDYRSILGFAYVLQVACMYILTGLIKWREKAWQDGYGLEYALELQMFTTRLGDLASQLPTEILRFSNYALLGVEVFLPILLFIPWRVGLMRVVCMVTMVFFHVAVFLTLKVGLFGLICCVAWVPLLPAGFWGWAQSRLGISGQLSSIPSTSAVGTARGHDKPRMERWMGWIIVSMIVLWNLPNLHPKLDFAKARQLIRTPMLLFGLDQRWAMFSKPVVRDGWITIPGVQHNGNLIDLFTNEAYEGTKRPQSLSSRFEKDRWRKIWQNLMGSHKNHMLGLGRYLCRRSGRNSDPAKRVEAFEIIMISEELKPGGKRGDPRKSLLWRHECVKGMIAKWKTKLPYDTMALPTTPPKKEAVSKKP